MLVTYFLISIAYKSSYQEVIDLTKASALKFKTFSNHYLNEQNNQVKFPGNYYEKNVYYKVHSPIFATDSVIVKGLHIQNDLLGIIPTNFEYFDNISKSFNIIDRKLQKIYKMEKFIEKTDGVYIFSIQNEDATSAFDIKCVNLTTHKSEKEVKDIGLKFIFDIIFDKSTKTNVFTISTSLNYETNGKEDYSLDNVKEFTYPKNNSLGEWNKVLSHLLLGMKLDFEIKMTGFLDGTIELTTNFIGGIGFNVELEKYVEDIIQSKCWEIFKIPYVPMDSYEIFGVKLGLELGFKFETFFESLKITLPTIRVIGGLYYNSVVAMNYNLKSPSVISNFRIINASPQILKDVPSISKLIEAISLRFIIRPSVIPFYIKLDLLGINAELNVSVNIPFLFEFNGNMNCNKFVDFSLDYGVDINAYFRIHVPILIPNITDLVNFEIIKKTNILKQCITDYTDKYKEELLKNAKDRDNFTSNDTDYQSFGYSTNKLEGTNYTCEFTEPYEDGMILVEISYFYLVIYARIIFKIENGYILPNDKSNTKLKDDDIYIGKIFTNYVHFGNNGTYYYRIKFKRYKQENVVFHFYNVYTIQDNDGNYICPKVYAIDTTASVLKNACIGTKATPLMMQCCNDCKYNFCIDDIERRSLSKNYHFLYRSRNYNHDNGHPLWVPRYHIFPDNLESFVIPANEWAYVPRVKCDRCDSVQFIINNTIYNSKYFGKTKLFSPIIPTNGYDYFPYDDLKNVKANKLNSLKGITNQDVRVIAICNDNNNS